ncbi:hypothetical protein EV702DRAFT_48009 [Suillus placidus]|uniref:Uncharacterized protein n=1 Tax=Suillus placidus TaxID=48579 RepID=A0A9P7A035_9AGAM|nr:hypothetical protein EV702DRAFT_48009 [Suillus placidus]
MSATSPKWTNDVFCFHFFGGCLSHAQGGVKEMAQTCQGTLAAHVLCHTTKIRREPRERRAIWQSVQNAVTPTARISRTHFIEVTCCNSDERQISGAPQRSYHSGCAQYRGDSVGLQRVPNDVCLAVVVHFYCTGRGERHDIELSRVRGKYVVSTCIVSSNQGKV